jgi:lysophospholipase L1-like esterase
MIAGLVAIVVMLPLAMNRTVPTPGDLAPTAGTGANASATPSGSAEPAEAAEATRVLVVGDADAGGTGPAAWPALLGERLPDVEADAVTTGDSGYVSAMTGEQTLPDLVAVADLAGVDVVVLSGSRFDAAGISDRVSTAAQEAIGAVREKAPDADLVVIGPLWPGGGPPAGVRNNRDVIRSAAEAASVRFVDPLADGWLTDGDGLVAGDDVHLTAAGQEELANLVQPQLEEVLEARVTGAGG